MFVFEWSRLGAIVCTSLCTKETESWIAPNFPSKMPPRKAKPKAPAAAEVVSSSRFKTLKVTERTSIKNFVEKHKLKFATGRGFYQLSKPETIQFHKEVVVRRKADGTMASGDEVQFVNDKKYWVSSLKYLDGKELTYNPYRTETQLSWLTKHTTSLHLSLLELIYRFFFWINVRGNQTLHLDYCNIDSAKSILVFSIKLIIFKHQEKTSLQQKTGDNLSLLTRDCAGTCWHMQALKILKCKLDIQLSGQTNLNR